MLCCICKSKEATVHLTQITGDKMHKVDLCEECSKSKGVDDPAGFSLADLLLGLGAAQEIEQSSTGDSKCPKCGFTQADFKKAGRLGCSECYTTFAEGLEGLLKTMHKGVRHVGKVPPFVKTSRDYADRIKGLQKKLAKAIEDENFEQAAQFRDEIREISLKLGNAPAI
jgi:protein arginine kinase activator